MYLGYKLSAEGFGPQELIRQAMRAEEAGFDFVEMSDHYHPWLEAQGHSPFARTVLVEHYRQAGGQGLRYAEVPVAWAEDEQAAIAAALRTSRFAVTGWKVMSELPNPVNFEAATVTVDADDIRRQFAVGPDPHVQVDAVRTYLDAGFDHIVLQNAGPDPDGFLSFFQHDLSDRLRSLDRPSVSA